MLLQMAKFCSFLRLSSIPLSLEKGMAIHSSTLAWRTPWTEEPGGLYVVWGPAKAIFSSLSFPTGDKELIQEVLFDAVVSAPIEAYWTSLALNKSE